MAALRLPSLACLQSVAVYGLAVSLMTILSGGSALSAGTTPLELVQTIALPDVRGRIDHLDIDLEGERLFVAALGNDTVEIVDLHAGRRSEPIHGLQEPQGVAYIPDAKRLAVANGRGGRVDIFDGTSLAALGRVEGLDDADNLRYAPDARRLYVGYGSALAVLDMAAMQRLTAIKLAGHPESFQLASGTSRIFVNVPSAEQIAVVDPGKAAIVATWPLGSLKANFPMALDEPDHRLFVATRRPARLLVYDAASGSRIAEITIGGDADDLFFDAEHRRIYVICGEGVIDVVEQLDVNRYRAVTQLKTSPGARTGLFVPQRKTLYVAVPATGGSAAEIRVYRIQ